MDENEQKKTEKKSLNEAKMDLKVSWELYKENWKTFIGFQLFTIVSAMLILFASIFIMIILIFSISNVLNTEFPSQVFMTVGVVSAIPNFALILILGGCLYGLGYDLICSGDEYTEIKNAVGYFAHYWWQYFIIGMIQGIFTFLWSLSLTYTEIQNSVDSTTILTTTDMNYLLSMVFLVVFSQMWFYLFGMLMPSVTATGSIKKAFKENFIIIKTEGKRMLYVFLFYMLISTVPTGIILTFFYDRSVDLADYNLLNDFPMIIVTAFNLFVVNPLIALSLTRIYNTSKIGIENLEIREIEKKRIGIRKFW
jgi:hypothetical protein